MMKTRLYVRMGNVGTRGRVWIEVRMRHLDLGSGRHYVLQIRDERLLVSRNISI